MKANYENLKTIEVTTPGTDLNDYIENGRFFYNNANTPTNKPNDVLQQAGYLDVFARNSNTIIQIWIEYGNYRTWQRQKVNGNWGGWALMAQEKSYMVASTNQNTTVTATTAWTRQQLVLATNRGSFGNAFTFINGGIKANRKCKVRISANAMVTHPADKQVGVSVMINNQVVMEGYHTEANSNWSTIGLSSFVTQLNANDLISLNYSSNANGVEMRFASGNYTYLTVEEIG